MINKIFFIGFFSLCILVLGSCIASSVTFDSVTYGVSVNIGDPGGSGSAFDRVDFGVKVVVEDGGGTGGYTGWSDTWEIYHLGNRYDVNVDGYVLSSDANLVWSKKQGSAVYDYLYDVNNDGYVLSSDANKVWSERYGT